MYHYIKDKDFLKSLKMTCSDIVNQLVQSINNDSVMTVKACLVGSGAKNLITQNENEIIDLDYNICILKLKCSKININNGRDIKEYIRKKFNKVLNVNGLSDCQDSTSVLTTKKLSFDQGNKTQFKIDIAITYKTKEWHKLIHKKIGFVANDRYYWNAIPDSSKLEKRVKCIKSNDLWRSERYIS